MHQVILRLIHKKVESAGTLKLRTGLFGDEYVLREYHITTLSFIVQSPDMVEVEEVSMEGVRAKFNRKLWISYCRWHNGPLNEPDDPSKRIYCNVPAEGFCRQHKRSLRAIYERCVTLKGLPGFEACKVVDAKAPTKYAVYLTDFGGAKPKVGITRKFRLLERIAEQTHIAATVIAEVNSAYEARKLETRIASSGLAQELHGRSVMRTRGVAEAVSRLHYWASRISEKFSLNWKGEIFRVRPPNDLHEYVLLRKPESLEEDFYVRGFWGGFLFVETASGRKLYFNSKPLQHKDSLVLS
jgi:hypothetical protein